VKSITIALKFRQNKLLAFLTALSYITGLIFAESKE